MTIPLEEIEQLVGLQLGLRQVNGSDLLQEHLGAESVDMVNIVAAAESQYRVVIDESELPHIRSVADLHRLINALLQEPGSGRKA